MIFFSDCGCKLFFRSEKMEPAKGSRVIAFAGRRACCICRPQAIEISADARADAQHQPHRGNLSRSKMRSETPTGWVDFPYGSSLTGVHKLGGPAGRFLCRGDAGMPWPRSGAAERPTPAAKRRSLPLPLQAAGLSPALVPRRRRNGSTVDIGRVPVLSPGGGVDTAAGGPPPDRGTPRAVGGGRPAAATAAKSSAVGACPRPSGPRRPICVAGRHSTSGDLQMGARPWRVGLRAHDIARWRSRTRVRGDRRKPTCGAWGCGST